MEEITLMKFWLQWRVSIIKAAAVLLAVLAFVWAVYRVLPQVNETESTVSSALLVDEVRSIRELSSLKKDYSDIVEYKSADWIRTPIFGIRLVSSENNFKVTYYATVRIGYDLDKVGIDIDGKHITIRYPHSKILSHEINDVKVHEWKNGLWNKLDQKVFMAKLAEQSDIYIKNHFRDFDREAGEQFERIVLRHIRGVLSGAQYKNSSNEVFGSKMKTDAGYSIEFVRESRSIASKFN